MDYIFSNDWFIVTDSPNVWTKLPIKERKMFLEIGSFEGRSSIWTAENLLQDDGSIYCIDTWEGGVEHSSINMVDIENNFNHNVKVFTNKYPNRKIIKCKGTSYQELIKFPEESFDFIFVDGSHKSKDVLIDMCISWKLLKHDGIMVLDDYIWNENVDIINKPQLAIDSFLNIFYNDLELLYKSNQVIIKKNES